MEEKILFDAISKYVYDMACSRVIGSSDRSHENLITNAKSVLFGFDLPIDIKERILDAVLKHALIID